MLVKMQILESPNLKYFRERTSNDFQPLQNNTATRGMNATHDHVKLTLNESDNDDHYRYWDDHRAFLFLAFQMELGWKINQIHQTQ